MIISFSCFVNKYNKVMKKRFFIIVSVLFSFIISFNVNAQTNVELTTNKTEACEDSYITLSVSVNDSSAMDSDLTYYLQKSTDGGLTWKEIILTTPSINVPIFENSLFRSITQNNTTNVRDTSNVVSITMLKLIDFELPDVIDSICGEFNLEDLSVENISKNGLIYYQHSGGKVSSSKPRMVKTKTTTKMTVVNAETGGCNCSNPSIPDPFNPNITNPSNPDPSDPNPSDPSDPSDPTNPSDPSNPNNPNNPSDPTNPSNPSDPSNPNTQNPSTSTVIGFISYHNSLPSSGTDYSHEITNPIINESQMVYVTIVNQNGRYDIDSVQINFLSKDECCPELFIPNSFSPNGDGVNDLFEVKGLECYDNAKLEVYNQWGKLVYKQDNYGVSGGINGWWNGSNNQQGNTDLTATTYYFLLSLQKNGVTTVHKEYVYINR